MNPRLRTGIIAAAIGLGFILIGIIAVGSLLRGASSSNIPPTPVPEILVKAIVTSHDLPLGTLLREDDVIQIEVPVEFAPRNVISEVGSVVGRITTTHLVKGEIILDHNLANPTNSNFDLAYVIPNDYVLMAFQPGDLMTRLSLVQRGDIIDIFVTIEQSLEVVSSDGGGLSEQTETFSITFDAFQRIGITAMVVNIIQDEDASSSQTFSSSDDLENPVQAVPTPRADQITIVSYLLALPPQDALVLKYFKDNGAIIDIVLRSPSSTLLFELSPVMEEYIKELYQLEIIQ